MTSQFSLDISKLMKVRSYVDKITSRCPACAELERDRHGNNLTVFSSGAFHCHAFPRDKEHNARIFTLVGNQSKFHPDLEEIRRWRERKERQRFIKEGRDALVETARTQRQMIVTEHQWKGADVRAESPQPIDRRVEYDPRHFIDSLFPATSLIWTGQVDQSGSRHADRWRTASQWQQEDIWNIGPMISPAIWIPGTVSRSRANIASNPYTVLDFDGFDGAMPETQEEAIQHIRASLALVRWIHKGLKWDLHAILWTGSKSIHAWFKTPSTEVLESLRPPAKAFGIDEGLIGRSEHPCRLPGYPHAKTAKRSRVLWLK